MVTLSGSDYVAGIGGPESPVLGPGRARSNLVAFRVFPCRAERAERAGEEGRSLRVVNQNSLDSEDQVVQSARGRLKVVFGEVFGALVDSSHQIWVTSTSMTILRQHWRMVRRRMETRDVRKMTKGSGIVRMTVVMSENRHGLGLGQGLRGKNGNGSGAAIGTEEIMAGKGRQHRLWRRTLLCSRSVLNHETVSLI